MLRRVTYLKRRSAIPAHQGKIVYIIESSSCLDAINRRDSDLGIAGRPS